MTASAAPPAALADAAGLPSDIQGFLDAFENDRAYGWAFDRAHPDARLRIEVRFGEALVAETIANRPRPDLKDGGVGDGACAFEALVDAPQPVDAAVSVVAVNPSTGARHVLVGRAPDKAAPATDAGKLESLVETLHAAHRRAFGALQAAERKFDDAATRINRLPDLSRLAELGHALDQIRAVQGDLARRIAEAEVFLVRFDSVLNAMEKTAKNREPEATFTRQSLLSIGLGIIATVATVAAVLMALLRH